MTDGGKIAIVVVACIAGAFAAIFVLWAVNWLLSQYCEVCDSRTMNCNGGDDDDSYNFDATTTVSNDDADRSTRVVEIVVN
ncbi:MAG: hypothetical protein CMK92_05100 [Pseudomonas sp.]|nr:hypothetical protein [Pseudomonas sp.]